MKTIYIIYKLNKDSLCPNLEQVQIEGKEKINIKEIKIKNIDIIEPILYISEDNKKFINSIENKLKLIIIDNSSKKRNLQTKSKVRSIHSSLEKITNQLKKEIIYER